MSQYMLLIRNEGIAMEGLSEQEVAEHMQKWGAWMGGLGEQGKLVAGHPFSTESTAILSNSGSTVTHDYNKEANNVSVGGYLLINADNLDQAIEISKGCPALESPTSSIEVRECVEMTVPQD